MTPSYDLKSLWVLNDLGDSLTRIDPKTGEKRETIPVKDPYNMYYTPDGKYAIVVAEREKRLNFYDAQSMKFAHSLPYRVAALTIWTLPPMAPTDRELRVFGGVDQGGCRVP